MYKDKCEELARAQFKVLDNNNKATVSHSHWTVLTYN